MFTAEGNTNVKGRTQYPIPGGHLPSKNVWRPPKLASKCPGGGRGGRVE